MKIREFCCLWNDCKFFYFFFKSISFGKFTPWTIQVINQFRLFTKIHKILFRVIFFSFRLSNILYCLCKGYTTLNIEKMICFLLELVEFNYFYPLGQENFMKIAIFAWKCKIFVSNPTSVKIYVAVCSNLKQNQHCFKTIFFLVFRDFNSPDKSLINLFCPNWLLVPFYMLNVHKTPLLMVPNLFLH